MAVLRRCIRSTASKAMDMLIASPELRSACIAEADWWQLVIHSRETVRRFDSGWLTNQSSRPGVSQLPTWNHKL